MLKVEFEDQGQPLISMIIGDNDIICHSFRHQIWKGERCINRSMLEPGAKLMLEDSSQIPRTIKFPIHKVTELPLTNLNHKRRGHFSGWITFDTTEDIEVYLDHDVPGRTASDLWRRGDVVLFKKSFLVPEKKKREKVAISVEEPPARLHPDYISKSHYTDSDYRADRADRLDNVHDED